jgi:hypothetical protein
VHQATSYRSGGRGKKGARTAFGICFFLCPPYLIERVYRFWWEQCGLLWYTVAVSVRVAARIPDVLAERIAARASSETRSLSNMIERLLELGLGQVVTERDQGEDGSDGRLGSAVASVPLGGESTEPLTSPAHSSPRSVTVCPNRRFHRSGVFCKACGLVG